MDTLKKPNKNFPLFLIFRIKDLVFSQKFYKNIDDEITFKVNFNYFLFKIFQVCFIN